MADDQSADGESQSAASGSPVLRNPPDESPEETSDAREPAPETAGSGRNGRRDLGSLTSGEIAIVRAHRSAKAEAATRLEQRLASLEDTLSEMKGVLMRFTGTVSENVMKVTPFRSGEKTPATGPRVRVRSSPDLGPEPSLPPDTSIEDLVESGQAWTDKGKNSWMVWEALESDGDNWDLTLARQKLKACVASSYKANPKKRPRDAGSSCFYICKHAACPVEVRIDPLKRRDKSSRRKFVHGWCLRRLVSTPGVLIHHNHDPGDITPGVSRRRIEPLDAFGDPAVGVDDAEPRLVWGVPGELRRVIDEFAIASDTRAGKGAAVIRAALVNMQRDGDIPKDVPLPTCKQIKVCPRLVS